jgi:hypothetical protein
MTLFKDERKVANPNRNYSLNKNLSKLPALHKVLIAKTRFEKIEKVKKTYTQA